MATVPKGCRLTPGQVEIIGAVLEKRETFSEFLRTAGVREARRRMATRELNGSREGAREAVAS